MLPNAQLSQKRQRLHVPILTITQLSQKTQKMQISRGLGSPAQSPTQDPWRSAFFEFFETVVQLVRLVHAKVAFFETVVHLVTLMCISLNISLYICLYLSISPNISLYTSVSLYPCISIYIFIYLSTSPYISLYLSASL